MATKSSSGDVRGDVEPLEQVLLLELLTETPPGLVGHSSDLPDTSRVEGMKKMDLSGLSLR